jgi:hypothetical protein
VSAAVAAPSAMEPATAMETATTAAEIAAAVETAGATAETATAVETTGATAETATAVEAASAAPEAAAIEATATAETASATSKSRPVREAAPTEAATVEFTTSIETMEPRASPDEESVYKPIGAVVAVRRARIRVIAVVAVCASRTWTQIDRTNSNCNLRMGRKSRREHANGQ